MPRPLHDAYQARDPLETQSRRAERAKAAPPNVDGRLRAHPPTRLMACTTLSNPSPRPSPGFEVKPRSNICAVICRLSPGPFDVWGLALRQALMGQTVELRSAQPLRFHAITAALGRRRVGSDSTSSGLDRSYGRFVGSFVHGVE